MPDEVIVNKIYLFRGQKVMLDSDLAKLYGTSTKRLKEQVNRNRQRFPEHFLFELCPDECENLRSQNATLGNKPFKYAPYAFTEHGVLMLASVLKSEIAVAMSIKIIDVFVRLRETLLQHKDILSKLEQLESQLSKNSDEIEVLFKAVKQLIAKAEPPRESIGFKRS